MIQDGDYDRNVDMDKIPYLFSDWDAKHYMYAPSISYMKEFYAIKFHSHDHYTTMYMETLSREI